MRGGWIKRRAGLPVAALATAVLVLVAPGAAEVRQVGTLRVSFAGDFSPRSLPRDRPVPITVSVRGGVSTTDGSRPPILQRIEIELNRNGRIFSRGLATCRAPELQSATTQAALNRCRAALVGRGSFSARIDFPGLSPIPARGQILAFNGRHRGGPALLLQLHAPAPAQVGFVVPLAIEKRARGRFGTLLSARLPTLAGGSATVTQIALTLGREFNFEGRRRGFLSAACSAPAGFPGAVFTLARGTFEFSDGRSVATSLTRDCRVRR